MTAVLRDPATPRSAITALRNRHDAAVDRLQKAQQEDGVVPIVIERAIQAVDARNAFDRESP